MLRKLLLIGLSLYLLATNSVLAETTGIKVLAVHSYHQGYSWTNGQHRGFANQLSVRAPSTQYQIRAEYLDTKRQAYDADYQLFFVDYLKNKYRHFKPDILYTTDDDALHFAQQYLVEFFPNTPLVFSGVNDLKQAENRNKNVDGVFERSHIDKNLELIQRRWPNSDLTFVGDNSSTHIAMAKDIREQADAMYPGRQQRFIASRQLDDVLKTLKQLTAGPILLTTIGGFVDAEGEVVTVAEAVKQLRSIGGLQIFIMEDTFLQPGVIGGWVNSSEAQGEAAANKAVSMLDGTHSDAAITLLFPSKPIFRFQELQSSGIEVTWLPDDAVVIGEPTGFIYKYKKGIISIAIAALALVGIIVLLSINIRRRIKAERQMFRLFEDAPDAIYLVGLKGQILDVNQHAVDSLGYSRQLLKQMTVFDFNEVDNVAGHTRRIRSVMRQGGGVLETRHRRIDGHIFPVEVRITRCDWEKEDAFLCFARDITDRKNIEQQLRDNEERLNYLAFHDSLTGLPNRLLFQDRLEHAMTLAHRNKTKLAVLFLDLDRFKNINDSLGHDIGDQILTQVAQRLTAAVRETDTVARLGGDEFVLLIENIKDNDKLITLVDKILERVTPAINLKVGEMFVTTSLGGALYPDDASSAQALMKCADVAMYKAKETRNSYAFYQPEMDARATEFLFMESNLRRALELNQFVLQYQPQFELDTGQLKGVEVLLRWNHPEKGVISPGDFIPLAEESGLIVPIGEWVLTEACRQLRVWLDMGLEPVTVAVNISPRQFHLPDWQGKVAKILEHYELDPRLLELEITENSLMQDTEAAIETMEALHQLGVAIAIDDFGSGFSSMAYLRRFPLNKIKIDRSFVADLDNSESNAAIIRAVINLGWSLGLQIVAEGIEEQSQLKFLKDKGCHLGQGFFLSRPIDADAFQAILAESQSSLSSTASQIL